MCYKSPAIDMAAVGKIHVRMRPAGTTRQDAHLITVDVALKKASIYIILSPHSGSWPFTIEIKSDYEVAFGQIDRITLSQVSSAFLNVQTG